MHASLAEGLTFNPVQSVSRNTLGYGTRITYCLELLINMQHFSTVSMTLHDRFFAVSFRSGTERAVSYQADTCMCLCVLAYLSTYIHTNIYIYMRTFLHEQYIFIRRSQ